MEAVGIRLVADGADSYLATLTGTAAAEQRVAAAAQSAVSGVNALDDSQGQAAQAARAMGMTINEATGEITVFGVSADGAASDAAALGQSADKAGKDVDDLGDRSQKGAKGVDGLGEKSEKSSRGLEGLKQAAIGAAREIGANLVDAAAEAGQAILQFVGDSINKAGDFETGMNRFAAVAGDALADSGQSLEEFKDLFISLGRELPVSTAAVQEAAIEMAKGGIEPATIAAGGLRDVLNLAAAGEVEIAEAAEIASKQLGVWVDQAASADEKAAFLTESVDLLSQAANASTVGVSDLALGLANTGKSADIAGLSFRETVTSMALISSGFSSAADAGTSFKTFLQRLTPTTDTQAEAFKRLNLLTAEGTSIFYDETGAFIGMEAAAAILQDRTAGLGDAQKKMALEAAFGSDAIRAAGMLADAGAEGYAAMAASMAKAGSAAVQAARKQQGFNVAVDNAMGSVEALQLTVMSAALPALTKLVNLFATGVNAVTEYADATMQGDTVLAQIAGTVQTLAIPALYGLTAALIAYAVVQGSQAIPAILASLPAIAAQTTAFLTNALAVAAAAAPFVILAGAVAGVAWAYQDLQSKIQAGTMELLESKEWWNTATDAVQRHTLAVGADKEALAPYATEIQNIQTQLQKEIASLAERDNAGLVSDAQRAVEIEHINALAAALEGATGRYTDKEQALIRETAASMTATSQAAQLQQAESNLSTQTSLTAKDIEELGKKIQTTFQQGQEALTSYAQSYSEFASGVESRGAEFAAKMEELEKQKQAATTEEQRQGIDKQIEQLKSAYAEQEQQAAQSYAAQQTAQRQHLGQMLIDYTVAQAQLGNISKAKAAEITKALEEEYGLQESSTATTFLNMAQSIDAFAQDSGASIDSLVGDLRDQEEQAKTTQKAMDDYAKEYVATQVNNFLDGKTDADDYISSLERIPTEITTTVTTKYETEGEPPDVVTPRSGARAAGGPVAAGGAYLVGEKGPELITPTTAGYVTPTDALMRAMASTAQMGAAQSGHVTNNNQQTSTITMPIYTNQSPAVLIDSYATISALAGMGV